LITRIPLGVEDLVELEAELVVTVTDQKQRTDVVVELHQQVARLLPHPWPVRVRGDPSQGNAPVRKLDKEQHREPFEKERVDVRKSHSRMPRRSRLDSRPLEDRPDRARRQLDPEPDQLSLDTPVPPRGVPPRLGRPRARNLDRRLEVLARVSDAALRKRLDQRFDLLSADDALAWELMPDGTWRPPSGARGSTARTQLEKLARTRSRRTAAV